MGKAALKNWSPREVKRFLIKNGFIEVKLSGTDHCGLKNPETDMYTEVDMGRDSFSAREMLTFIGQTGIPKEDWRKNKKIKMK